MKVYRAFELRWYHLLIALGGLVAVIFVLALLFLSKDGVRTIVEDKTDIVG
ncbi:MAG: hypothetical protein GY867_09885 [bacterium]|nr:hypothetical protein [bacterium]